MQEFIGIFTEDGLDLVAGSTAEANAHRRDLINMGCTVNILRAGDESTLYAVDDWIRDGRSFAVARGRVEAGQVLNPEKEKPAFHCTAEDLPRTLNGYPLCESHIHKNCVSVMVIRDPENAPDFESFAVATWWRDLGDSWSWGHYFDGPQAEAEARDCIREVSERNRNR